MAATNGSALPSATGEITEKGKGKAVDQTTTRDMDMDEDEDSSSEESVNEEAVCSAIGLEFLSRRRTTD